MGDNNHQRAHFNRHRQYLNQWLQHLYPPSDNSSYISTQHLSRHIYTQLLEIQKHPQTHPKQKNKHPPSSPTKPIKMEQNPQQKQAQILVSIEQLWEKNENFMQCLKDLCEDLLYYVYVGDCLRGVLPRCLIGYYELVKNIVCIDGHGMRAQTKKDGSEGQIGRNPLPKQLQSYLKQKLIRILLIQCPYSYIRSNLTKLQQQSPITLNFRKQISSLLISRFTYFCKLYSLTVIHESKTHTKLSQYFITELLQNLSEDTNIQVSIDLVMLCIIYSVYRISRYLILFSNIINIYERECELKVDRQKLLDFYNTEFIIKLLPSSLIENIKIVELAKGEVESGYGLDLPHRQEDAMKSSGVGVCINSFQYDQIKEQKSIYDMFQ